MNTPHPPTMHASTRHRPPQAGQMPLKAGPRETHRLLHVLMRERSRIDRCGGMLALVVFHVPRPWWRGRQRMRHLLSVLKRRLRITDEVGLIDGQRAFALLPDTDPIGAEVLARQVQRRLAEDGLHFSFAVFRYVSGRFRQAQPRNDHDDREGGGGTGHHPVPHLVEDPAGDPEPALPVRVARVAQADPSPQEREACLLRHFPQQLPWWKRAIDIAVASAALVAVSPVLLTAAAAIRLESDGPVLFKQLRTGAGRQPFRIYKFRTMVDGAERRREELLEHNEQDGPAFKIRHDPRVTRVGRILRATSIDELPQLLNVLRGEMTLVGPRPLPVHEADGCESWQDARHSVHPGLTCIWQVKGRSRVSFEDWARMDLRYIRRRTLWQDLKILAATVPAVIKRDGAC